MSNAVHETDSKNTVASKPPLDPHLKALENEAIHIFREVAAEFDNPVMLYSIGKDSSVLLHLARKAFFPGRIPFPLLHVNTGWKFKEMIRFATISSRNMISTSFPTPTRAVRVKTSRPSPMDRRFTPTS